jgi:hypothetical protein
LVTLQEPLLPTPTNINPIHLSADDLLVFVKVQQWLAAKLQYVQPLLQGLFVLAPAADLQQQLLPGSEAECGAAAATACSDSSGAVHVAAAAAVPWRLRQVSCVEVCPGDDPADATVVLVGGERVRAGAVKQGQLAEAQDYQVGVIPHNGWLMRCVC